MVNLEVREAMKKARLFGYEVAAELGITESSFSRKLARHEMSSEEKARVLAAIERAAKGAR